MNTMKLMMKDALCQKEVDKYFFSEILYDVQLATDSNLGHNESWRNKR